MNETVYSICCSEGDFDSLLLKYLQCRAVHWNTVSGNKMGIDICFNSVFNVTLNYIK